MAFYFPFCVTGGISAPESGALLYFVSDQSLTYGMRAICLALLTATVS